MGPGLIFFLILDVLFVLLVIFWKPLFGKSTIKKTSPASTATLIAESEPSPLVPPCPIKKILFDAESDDLSASGRAALDLVVEHLQRHPQIKLSIEGTSDQSGNPSRNLRLAMSRSLKAKQYLISRGIAAERIDSAFLPPILGATPDDKASLRSVRLRTF